MPESDPAPLARLDLLMQPDSLRAHTVIVQGQTVVGIQVTTSVSFADTQVPLAEYTHPLDPIGGYSFLLTPQLAAKKVELAPVDTNRKTSLLRFAAAAYRVEVSLHMSQQDPRVQTALRSAFGYGESAKIPLAEGSVRLGGAAGAIRVRANHLTTLRNLHNDLSAACQVAAALERGSKSSLVKRMGRRTAREAEDLSSELERYVALPDQDLVVDHQHAVQVLLEFANAGQNRKQAPVARAVESLRKLRPTLAARSASVLGY